MHVPFWPICWLRWLCRLRRGRRARRTAASRTPAGGRPGSSEETSVEEKDVEFISRLNLKLPLFTIIVGVGLELESADCGNRLCLQDSGGDTRQPTDETSSSCKQDTKFQ